jgi:hypothetical protein
VSHIGAVNTIARQAVSGDDVPYIPGELSQLYYSLSLKERAKVNADVDQWFRHMTGIRRRLNWNDAKDVPLARGWLRLRDLVMRRYKTKFLDEGPESGTPPPPKAEDTKSEAETEPPSEVRESPIPFVERGAQLVSAGSGLIHLGELAFHSLKAISEFSILAEGIITPVEVMSAILEANEAGRKWGFVQGASYAIVALALGKPIPKPTHLQGMGASEAREGYEAAIAMFHQSSARSEKTQKELEEIAKHPLVQWAYFVHTGQMPPNEGIDKIYLYLSKEHLEEKFLFIGGLGATYHRAIEYRLKWPGPELVNRAYESSINK